MPGNTQFQVLTVISLNPVNVAASCKSFLIDAFMFFKMYCCLFGAFLYHRRLLNPNCGGTMSVLCAKWHSRPTLLPGCAPCPCKLIGSLVRWTTGASFLLSYWTFFEGDFSLKGHQCELWRMAPGILPLPFLHLHIYMWLFVFMLMLNNPPPPIANRLAGRQSFN